MRLKVRKSTLFRIGLVAAVLVISMLVFASLAEDLVNQETLSTLDPVFGKWLIAHTSLSGNHIFSTITFLGNSLIISIGTGLLGFWLAKRKLWNQLIFLLLIIGGSALLNLLLKNIFQRSRPAFTLAYQVETGFSFPSGHAMISLACYGAIAYLAFALLKSRRGKVLVGIGAVVLSAIIGFSRLYLGVHYLTDVLAGWAAGALCLMLAILGDYCFDLSKGKRQA
jgi:membrane-associated phospholipid phosphatase